MEDKELHTISMEKYCLSDFRKLIEDQPIIRLGSEVKANIQQGSQFLAERMRDGDHIYGVNSGFGALCDVRIDDEDLELLQLNHLLSHAAGVGDAVPSDIVRLMIFNKLLTFRSGNSGITLETAQRLVDFLNENIIPVIPRKGTLGASGDLAPLAHMSVSLLGMGEVRFRGAVRSARDVLRELGWNAIQLKPKEGLALTNGVQYINACAVMSLCRAERLIVAADIISALSCQAFSTAKTFYDPLYHDLSKHPERSTVAKNLSTLLSGSNHYELSNCALSKQDPYSFRCIPEVHAAVRQSFTFAKTICERECNSVSDNPLLFPKERAILNGGALHGESAALSMDVLSIGLAELGSISECRSYQLLSGQRGLPDFLVERAGINSGFMVAHYTAAALVNENKMFAYPAVIDTRPSCQLQEDHVSMGGTSAHKLLSLLDNLEFILAIELLLAAQAIDFNKIELKLSRATQEIYETFRTKVPVMHQDRILQPDIDNARDLLIKNAPIWQRRFDLH